jgi:hypothetical protein
MSEINTHPKQDQYGQAFVLQEVWGLPITFVRPMLKPLPQSHNGTNIGGRTPYQRRPFVSKLQRVD